MPSYTMLNVKIQRESTSVPWGFRMQGGRDFGFPLQIQKVNPNSLAERCGMQADDYIVKIGQLSTEYLQHHEAQEQIQRHTNILELILQRGAPPSSADYNSRMNFSSYQPTQPRQTNFLPQPQYQQSPQPQYQQPPKHQYQPSPQPQYQPSPKPQYQQPPQPQYQPPPQPQYQPSPKPQYQQPPQLQYQQPPKPQHQQPSKPQYQPPPPPYQSPPQTPAPQIFVPISNNRAISSQTYNTPIGLYSADNITNTLANTLKSMNMTSDQKIEEPRNSKEFQAPTTKSMPKPAPFDYTQQPRPAPYVAPSKPTTTNKPSFNANKQGAPGASNRAFNKGSKGSALLNQNDNTNQIAKCYTCGINIRGPFISAIGHCYCVDHFTCSNCSINLVDCGFVEENGKLYCENDFEQYIAPDCAKCSQKILKECVHALEKTWHPDCFLCTACKRSIGTGSFHVEEGQPYCAEDFRKMFQAKCTSCEFPIEPGDAYLEAMGGTYHAECFTCSTCQVTLDGQGFIVKNNRPYCRQHGQKTSSIFA